MGLLDKFVGRLTRGQSAGPYGLNDEDRQDLKRTGLLQAGLAMLSKPSNGMQGIAGGLLAGIQGVQQGADDRVNDRYRNATFERMQQQMDGNTARESAMRGVMNPDGTLNQEGLGQLAALDPMEAMRLRQQVAEMSAPQQQAAPTVRTFFEGPVAIQKQWDPVAGDWQEVGRGNRSLRSGGRGGSGGSGSVAQPGAASGAVASPEAASGGLTPRPGQPMTADELAAFGLPRGTSAMWDAKGAPKILRSPTADEVKQRTGANRMMPQLSAVGDRIERIKKAVAGLSENRFAGTGPLDQIFTAKTKQGQELAAAVAGIQNPMLALTRVPGIGAQSDLEGRIAALQFPSVDVDEGVNQNTIAELESFYEDLTNAFRNTLGDEFPGANAPAQPSGGPARPSSDAEFNALPVGALYIDPDDGVTYRKR